MLDIQLLASGNATTILQTAAPCHTEVLRTSGGIDCRILICEIFVWVEFVHLHVTGKAPVDWTNSLVQA